MGKVSPKDRQSKTPKQKRRIRNSSNKYLRPGALAQLRNSKASGAKSCTDLGKKRIAGLEVSKKKNGSVIQRQSNGFHGSPSVLSPERFSLSPSMLSPERFALSPVSGLANRNNVLRTPKTPASEGFRFQLSDVFNMNHVLRTPKTPSAGDVETESRLESLPMDLLVKILCHLHHDQLRPVFHVCQKIRAAVIVARQLHFNYTTPDRSRQEILRTMTPLPTEHWPFVSKGDGKGIRIPSPHTPKAPRHGPRPPPRFKCAEMRQIAAVLFQESSFPSRCMVPSGLQKPQCKSLASNRVLFYEDELCQAVAQNKLL